MEGIGQLAGGVAHDFNNILAAIMMHSELMAMSESISDKLRDGLQEIRAAAERAGKLTRQLLLFSRRQVMQPRDVDLNDIVKTLANMLQRIIGEDIRLDLHLYSAPLITYADAGMLDQVILNLAVNARDAMPMGGRLLIESSKRRIDETFSHTNPDAEPGRYVCLSVTDTGGGIPPEILPRIFEPFFTTKETGKGTGLGLATVYGIVKKHRGWVEVHSKPGQGASFQIFLPASKAARAAKSEIKATKPRGGKETILLVEDEALVRSITRAVLERYGYRVLEAANGMEALKSWEQMGGPVDLLLTDLVMPEGITGQQLANKLQEQVPNLQIIFISGYSAEIAGRALDLRAGENFLQKPFAPDQLLDTIRNCLDSD
jgi:CheY-like chemotaxis protein